MGKLTKLQVCGGQRPRSGSDVRMPPVAPAGRTQKGGLKIVQHAQAPQNHRYELIG